MLVFLTEIREASKAAASFPLAPITHSPMAIRMSTVLLILLRQTHALSSPAVEKTHKKDRKDGRCHLCGLGILTFLHGSHLDHLDHTFGLKRKQTSAMFMCAQGQELFLRGQEKSLFLDLKEHSPLCS